MLAVIMMMMMVIMMVDQPSVDASKSAVMNYFM